MLCSSLAPRSPFELVAARSCNNDNIVASEYLVNPLSSIQPPGQPPPPPYSSSGPAVNNLPSRMFAEDGVEVSAQTMLRLKDDVSLQ
jgi:hypothetical protein